MGRAEESLQAARMLLEKGWAEISVSRSYYAMFYAAEALLVAEGLRFKSHRAVVAAFGERFAKTARLDPALHRDLVEAFRQRQVADYEATVRIPRDNATDLLARADKFVSAVRGALEKGG